MKNLYVLFCFPLALLLANTSPINGMFIPAATVKRFQAARSHKSEKRNISFVPSTRYPGYLVCLNRDFTEKELEGAEYTKTKLLRYKGEFLIIKHSNFTEKEEAFANNPAYIGLPDSGAVWGKDCSPEKSSWFGTKNDYGYFPIVLFKKTDKWCFGFMPRPISAAETRQLVLADNPELKQKYPFLCDGESSVNAE